MNKLLVFLRKKITESSPPLVIFFSFVFVILIGALLLTLPISHEHGQSMSFIDALYTATSATCVTGLVIADTADTWSLFGELLILALIQIGGLGLITLTAFFMSAIGRKSGLKTMVLVQESLNSFEWHDSIRLIRNVMKLVFGMELMGAILLSIAFVPEFGLKGIYFGIFHSVSAFCNAGFDLLGGGRSLMDHSDKPLILYTINGLIMSGGLGFIVWQDLWNYRAQRKLRIHTKLVLIFSVFLWVFGSICIFMLESDNINTLGSMPTREAIDGAIFLSVNARTAGYAAMNLNAMNDVTKVFVSVLMFIGAASGSTAGGIKVNTLGVILIAVVSVIRSREKIVFQQRRININLVLRAFTIVMLSGIWLIATTFFITLLNPEFRLVNALFESASAFGTVGLSIGMTTAPTYNTLSKILHILTMFIGRIGPMTFAITLSLGNRTGVERVYPEGKIVVG